MISIVIPVYNVEKYLVDCLDSIINQNFSDWEVIMVNDGSTDHSDEIGKHGNLFNCNNNDYNYNGHQYDYEPTLYGTLFKVKVVHFLPDAIDQYYWLSYYDSFIQFCGEGNCTFDLGWIDRNSLHFIDFWPWNLLHLRVF